jgi:hypothetical protein
MLCARTQRPGFAASNLASASFHIADLADPDLPVPKLPVRTRKTLVVRIIYIAGSPPSTHHGKKDSRGKNPLPI